MRTLDLAGGAVGAARAAVLVQDEVDRTGAGVAAVWSEQTQGLTAAVVYRAGALLWWGGGGEGVSGGGRGVGVVWCVLSQFVVCLQTHR